MIERCFYDLFSNHEIKRLKNDYLLHQILWMVNYFLNSFFSMKRNFVSFINLSKTWHEIIILRYIALHMICNIRSSLPNNVKDCLIAIWILLHQKNFLDLDRLNCYNTYVGLVNASFNCNAFFWLYKAVCKYISLRWIEVKYWILRPHHIQLEK